MRKTVATGCYLLLTELIALYLVVWPVHAFQVSSSSTGYVRVATSAAIGAYQTAQRAAFTGALASAVSAPTVASVAVRIATGPVGWGLLGLSVALTLAGMYYSAQDVQAVKTAALSALPSLVTIPGWTTPAGTTLVNNCGAVLTIGCTQHVYVPNARPIEVCVAIGQSTLAPIPAGWQGSPEWPSGGPCRDHFFWTYNGANAAQQAFATPPTTITQAQAQSYINGLASGNANSIEAQTDPLGQGATVPAADNVTTLQVSPTDVVPTVKPAGQVVPTDAVIDPNAPPPSGPQPAVPSTQTTTTTTTTTTNPDGSVTQQEESTGSVSCSAGNHDSRTFGSVLQDHLNLWQGSGLLSALNLLKTLSWPTSIPTYSLTSSMFGNFTLDFSAWSGLLTALRSLIIAIASFVAYRIVFVGNT